MLVSLCILWLCFTSFRMKSWDEILLTGVGKIFRLFCIGTTLSLNNKVGSFDSQDSFTAADLKFASLSWSSVNGFSTKHSTINFKKFWQSSKVDIYPKDMRTEPVGHPSIRSMLSPQTCPTLLEDSIINISDTVITVCTTQIINRNIYNAVLYHGPASSVLSLHCWCLDGTGKPLCCKNSLCVNEY